MNFLTVIGIVLFVQLTLVNAAEWEVVPGLPTVELQRKAQAGNSEAQYLLAMKYLKGDGIAVNVAAALKWLRSAADAGHVGAEYQLGLSYRDGIGVPKNRALAMRWLQIAAGSGLAEAQTAYDALQRAQLVREFEALRAAAKGGDVSAQYALGRHYFTGKTPSAVDPAQALVWLTRAANQQHADAQYEVGTFYKEGIHVPRDLGLAKKWLAKAAAQNHVKSKVALQDIIRNEGGAAAGADKTFKSSESLPVYRAAMNGDVNSQYELGLLFIRGDAVSKDFTRGVELLQHAAEQNHLGAQLHLAEMHLRGMELKQDAAEAFKWYLRAAQRGDAQAQYMLGNLYRSGSGVAENQAEARRWYAAAAKQGYAKAQERIEQNPLNAP